MTILANNAVLAALRSGGPTQTLANRLLLKSVGGDGVFVVSDYGVLTHNDSSAATVNTNTFIAACDALEAAGGGVLYVPPGTYYVGKQDFAGASGLGYAYLGYHIIDIQDCTKPVLISASGVKLIMVAGMRYGSFDPVTGEPILTKQTSNNFKAAIHHFINLDDNLAPVAVVGPLELDGNIQNMITGGQWGDTGWQIPADGIEARDQYSLSVEDVHAHHCGRDGFQTSYFFSQTRNYGSTILKNCIGNFNGRDGWSIIGGNKVMAIDCEFSWQGKNSDYTTATIASSPGSGIDIENEVEAIRNVTLINVKCIGNGNHAIVSDSGNTEDIHLYGCTLVGNDIVLWCGTRGWRLYNCKVIGNLFDVFNATNMEDGFHAYGGLFSTGTTDYTDYPGSLTHAGGNTNFSSGKYCYFDGVTFRGIGMPLFQSTATDVMARFNNCNFDILSPDTVSTRTAQGFFTGRNVVKSAGSPFSIGNGANLGEIVFNDVRYGRGNVVAVTANRTLRTYEAGTTYSNEGAAALRTITLPTAVANLEYSFLVQHSIGMKIAAAAGDTIAVRGAVTASAGNIQSTMVGSTLTLRAINATEWVAIESFGPWSLTATATIDPASLPAPTTVPTRTAPATITVTGAALKDEVAMTFSLDLQGLDLRGYVSAANTVTYYFENNTAGAVDLASGTLTAAVRKLT